VVGKRTLFSQYAGDRNKWGMGLGVLAILALAMAARAASAQNLSVLYNFSGTPDGQMADGALLWVPSASISGAGTFCGTTVHGGSYNSGTIYKITPAGQYTKLHDFNGTDGYGPIWRLSSDARGHLYGTTPTGGTYGLGTVFKVSAAGQFSVLYNFTGNQDGGRPWGGLVLDADGNMYGTAFEGGAYQLGTVFKLTPTGQFSVIHSFFGDDGANPAGDVALDAAGNLYGTAAYGCSITAVGCVYKVNLATGQYTDLHAFQISDGEYPFEGVTWGADGSLYGMTTLGGDRNGDGVVYKVSSAGLFILLHAFTGSPDGRSPGNNVTVDPAGNVYGTTGLGGTEDMGTVFRVTPAGTYSVLYSFTGGASPAYPLGGVVWLPSSSVGGGSLYGATQEGGSSNYGAVFKLTF
jgi:uncharacterized repeat protein (TIGR03803 family)